MEYGEYYVLLYLYRSYAGLELMMKQKSPSNSDALAFSKREQLDTKGAVPAGADVAFSKKAQLDKKGAPPDAALPFSKKRQADTAPRGGPPAADLPFSKQQQMGKSPGATRSVPPTITRERPSLPDADLPFSKTKQMGKATGRKTRPAR